MAKAAISLPDRASVGILKSQVCRNVPGNSGKLVSSRASKAFSAGDCHHGRHPPEVEE
jgi:hypothetical protein